jgi:2-C-methyl-D-erythritol 4-phosphate cytidylyltransferase
MYIAKAPQSFRLGLILEYYKKARSDGVLCVDSSHLLSIYNVDMHTVKSTPNNLKITSATDYYIFRTLYEIYENQQILGV